MAVDFSRFNFFNRMDARARIFVLVAGVAVFILVVYLVTQFFTSGGETTGPTRVASTPQGLTSVQGGVGTPEYQRALQQANVQAAETAQMRGTSALPTMINIGGQAGCVICTDEATNVKNTLEDWARQGKISPEISTYLQQLADRNPSVDEYAAELDRLVREGKLTPEQARALLEAYKKQHANRLLNDSGKAMDGLIKNGRLPLDSANTLLAAQKNGVSPSDYAAMLQEMVRQGKISPETAAQLLAQYTQQRAKEIIAKSIVSLQEMQRKGEITPDVATTLIGLENQMVPFDRYASTITQLIDGGKITPAVARRILDEYSAQKKAIGPTSSIDQLLKAAEDAAYAELSELLRTGKITADVANQIAAMIKNDVSLADFQNAINTLVTQGKLTPEIAKLKIADYTKVKSLRDLQKRLTALQANNATADQYAEELKKAVAAGALTPEEAAQLLREYQALTAPAAAPETGAAADEFAALQQRLAEGAPTAAPTTDFTTVQQQTTAVTTTDRQARIDALRSAMEGQATQLINAWQPPVMLHKEGSFEVKKEGAAGAPGSAGAVSRTTETTTEVTGPAVIKAGTILFAILDTAINSDYPDSPVLATIVDGKFKGAKMMGKMVLTKGVAGQQDRVAINFTLMDMDDWPKSKSVTAYAIDPDTARTVMASSVDYHYLKRFGAIMATSFLQGYATAITNAGTSTTGIFGTSTTHPTLDPRQKFYVGLGQIGQNLGAVTQNWVNIPPTVRVDSGVSLGILFMAEVT